jgi:hydroxyacylglutathione hydrolase
MDTNRSASLVGFQFTVAIIGGGFTGATLAAQLLSKSGGSLSVILIERNARLGRGVAYGTRCMEHLLNVRARNMSAHPDDPEHFLRWARLNHDPGVTPDDYLPRRVYGEYVASLLQQEIERHPGRLEHVQDEAVSVARVEGAAEIRLRSGRTLFANKVVIALGNFPPGDPRLPGKTPHSQRYVPNPWAASAPSDLAKDRSILLVGSGLTSVDVAITLRESGFGGTIHMLSRRGLLPQTHKTSAPWPPFWTEKSPRTVRGLLRLIRSQVEAAEKAGSGWRAVIDSLRPFTQEIWRSLSFKERRRFLRHVRPYWDVHRHRIAPAIGARIDSQIQDGQIEIHAGRIAAYAEDSDGVDVTYRDRQSGELRRLRVDRVINCTGPESDVHKVDNPLLTNLIRQRLVRPDPLYLGLDVSQDGALVDVDGVASDFLYTIGPVRKGSLWETIAVPELRVQVSEVANTLLAACEMAHPAPEADPKSVRPASIAAIAQGEGSTTYFEQFYLSCLAHASYMLASQGEAVVVDPQRDVDVYLNAAGEHGLKIRHIFETHLHADFVSGHKELAARTGAKIYIGPNGGATVPHAEVRDGFELRVGKVRITVLETPGHTPESVCLVVTDEEKSPNPYAVLTGDTLFLGDVGRPDLSKTHTPVVLAGMLYDSLHNKLLKLPDDVLVYPAHGAGSLCGRKMRAERFSTVRTERLTNYALQIGSREEFIRQLTTNLPPRPEYFPQDAQINRAGAPALSDLSTLAPISAEELRSLLDEGAIALDVRPGDQFSSGHVPGSVSIPLSGEFAFWAGSLLGLSSRPVLIAESDEQLSEARTRLARVGIDDARGYLKDGVEGWTAAGLPLTALSQINAPILNHRFQNDRVQVLDVRRKPEWEAGHIEGAIWLSLDDFKDSVPQINPSVPIAVLCKGGYRSLIACSFLQRAGFRNVANVIGGFSAWEKAQLPFVTESAIVA